MKIVETIKIDTQYSNNYLVIYENRCFLVDCSCDVEDILKHTSHLDFIILTHGHYDHFYTLESIQKYFGCPVFMHKNALEKLTNPMLNASGYFEDNLMCNLPAQCVHFVEEGEGRILDVPVNIFYAFGHTNDSILALVDKNLFVGDFLFKNGYGRTDLPTGNVSEMYKNLRKYLPLRKKYNLWYGHNVC